MRIVMISDRYPPILGGAERQAQKLSREMARRGHRVKVVTGKWSMHVPSHEVDEGVEVFRLSTWNSMGGIRGIRKYAAEVFAHNLARYLRKVGKDADVFHVHFLRRAAAVALKVGSELGVPVLVKETSSGENNSFHTLRNSYRGPWLQSVFLQNLRHVAVLNAIAEREYAAEPFVDLTIHRVVNGIDVDGDVPVWDPDEQRPTILYLGSLREVKGVDQLVEAFLQIAGQRTAWRLRCCGSGDGLEELRRLAGKSPHGERIEFPGPTPNPLQELARASLLVLPSRAEGMSNTLLEAMVVGTPAVATRVGANPEMLEEGCGWLVDELTPEALARILLEATDSPEQRRVRSRCARERVRCRYTVSIAAERYERVYQSLC